MAYTAVVLSGSTNGKPIKIAATTSAGTLIHATTTTSTTLDEVYLYVYNENSVSVNMYLQWGGTTADETSTFSIPPQSGRYLLVAGERLGNSGSALEIRAYASVANKLYVTGNVNRITA